MSREDNRIQGYMWCTSNTAWTNDTFGLGWLTDVSAPLTSILIGERYILIMEGHSSHVTLGFIAHCIAHTIDLMVLPAQSLPAQPLHLTQPLDVLGSGSLNEALAK